MAPLARENRWSYKRTTVRSGCALPFHPTMNTRRRALATLTGDLNWCSQPRVQAGFSHLLRIRRYGKQTWKET